MDEHLMFMPFPGFCHLQHQGKV